MSAFAGLLFDSVTIVSPVEETDRYGSTVKSWDTTTSTVIRGRIRQRSTTESGDGREARTSTHVLFCLPSVTIGAMDRVTCDGVAYEVDGRPLPAKGGSGVHHLEVPLRTVEG